MKQFYKICAALLLTLTFGAQSMLAQTTTPTQVLVRDLNAYDSVPSSQADLPDNPLVGELVTFDAVVVSYPKNSGLASITDAGLPNRIHVFVADINAIEEGRDGMYIQFVHGGALRETMQELFPGDVIRVEGELTFYNNISQFDPSSIELLGSISTDTEYADLGPLLEPQTVQLGDINIPSPEVEGAQRWNAENYSKYNHMYVKIEGLEVIARNESPTGRPWVALSDGTSILYTTDTSLRFRNDRGSSYGDNLNYNYRRLPAELDGPYTPPPAGAIVDISGYIVVNTFNPAGFDESGAQSTLKIAPWDDGIVWVADGEDTANRVTEGVNNDMVVRGFPALVDRVAEESTDTVAVGSQPQITVTVDLPEDTYTLEGVSITYTAVAFDEDSAEPVTANLTEEAGQYSFTFPEFPAFTSISYVVEAEALTPESVRTVGRLSGNAFVEDETTVAPVAFSQPAGSYENSVTVELSTPTPGAIIYYTLDGSEPTTSSEVYAGSPLTFTENTTVRAFATASGLTDSPENSRTYTVFLAAPEFATLAELRQQPQDGTLYLYTGEATLTMFHGNRNQKWFQDETAAILIDDSPGVITTEYQIGDVVTGLLVSLTSFNDQLQANPELDPGDALRNETPQPIVVDNLAAIDVAIHEAALVTVPNVTFSSTGDFDTGSNYTIGDASVEEFTFRTNFFQADYIGNEIPSAALDLTGIVGNFRGTPQITARSSADFNFDVSADLGEMAYQFRLDQNFPNPFNPTTSINYTIGETANVNLVIYDVLGRRVATLVNEVQSPGFYNVNFDATRLASGTYIYRLETADQVAIRKMMLIK